MHICFWDLIGLMIKVILKMDLGVEEIKTGKNSNKPH